MPFLDLQVPEEGVQQAQDDLTPPEQHWCSILALGRSLSADSGAEAMLRHMYRSLLDHLFAQVWRLVLAGTV